MRRPPVVLCVGEILWDSLPAGLFLGGAPFNVAVHLRALGVPAALLSRVGDDRLGGEAIARARRLGVETDLIQTDPQLRTGFVSVSVDPSGSPTYDIVAPAAWDEIELTEAALARASSTRAIVFGSLAQRSTTTRETIARLGECETFRVFDVNLRPPFDDPKVVEASLRAADLVKLNEHELTRLSDRCGWPGSTRGAMAALAESSGCASVCVTRGEQGAMLLRNGRWSEDPGYRVDVVDTVGAGDAFLAALLAGLLEGERDEETLGRATLLGAFVASRPGALPSHDADEMARIARNQGAREILARDRA